MIRTFPDTGVLIDAARGILPFGRIAFKFLNGADRIFLTSPFIRLETLPKAVYMRREDEIAFYYDFFESPKTECCREWDRMEELAEDQAYRYGLGGMDALHLAAAHLLDADEFVTT